MENNGSYTEPTGDLPRSPPKIKPSSRLGRKDSDAKASKKIGHRRVTDQGTVTYKKTPTSEIQRAIQLGIQHSIGTLQQKEVRDVLFQDFEVIETVDFPRSGTKTTPAHGLSDFRFRTFAPVAFRCFRDQFQLDIRDYLRSLCSQELRELSNPGASGSIFYISADDEFIIKTVQHKEANFLQKLLPEYYMNLVQHTRTLLPKFYGLHCYQSSGKNIRFVVMNNLLPSSVKMHERYDLKGSSYKRKASERELAKASPTLKDLDFKERHPNGIWLEAETYDALMKTIERDCRVLESFEIMDYSLLLGVHNLDQAERDRKQKNEVLSSDTNNNGKKTSGEEASGGADGSKLQRQHHQTSAIPIPTTSSATAVGDNSGGRGSVGSRLRSASPFVFRGRGNTTTASKTTTKRLAAYSTAMESIEARVEPVEFEPMDPERVTLLGGLPARTFSGDRLFLFIGIIDILQSYRVIKKMEHTLKSVVIDAETVSVTNPSFYAKRFKNAIGNCIFRRAPSPMKQNSARKRQIQVSKPPPPNLNEVNNMHTSTSCDTASSVTTWPRQFYANPASRYSSTCSSGYATMGHNRRLLGVGAISPHPASVPLCTQGGSPVSDPYNLFFSSSKGELSWCEQSIMSLRIGSESDVSDDSTTSSSSSAASSANGRILREDGADKVMTTKGPRTVEELDLELAAVQKLVRKERTRRQREEAYRNRSASNLHLRNFSNGSGSINSTAFPNHSNNANGGGGAVVIRRPPLMRLAPKDSRARTPTGHRKGSSPKEGTGEGSTTSTVVQNHVIPPSTTPANSTISAFMKDAEADFDKSF